MRLLPTRPSRRDGAAAAELAVLLPFLCFLFVIAIDYARIFYFSVTMESAARNGAYFASNYPGMYSYQTAQQVAQDDLSNMTPAPNVAVNYSSNVDGPFTSTTPIANGYVEVKITWTFRAITQFPGVPNQTVLVRLCRMRVAPITPSF
ncbi:MAG: TadE/TadG family type IV pilus assembly protein [Gemmataceae bacterium]